MKRSEIAVGQVLFLADSTKWDDPDHYGFSHGQAVVVMDTASYYLRPADWHHSGYGRGSDAPSKQAGARGVLVVLLADCVNYERNADGEYVRNPDGSCVRAWNRVTEKVVSVTNLRGDWHEVSRAQEERAAAKNEREAQWRETHDAKLARRQACVTSLRALGYPADSEAGQSFTGGVVTMAPEYAEALVREVADLRAEVARLRALPVSIPIADQTPGWLVR